MFLIRSAFWLTVAFVTLHPHDIDIGRTAAAFSGQAMAAGQQLIAEQVLSSGCTLVHCPATAPNVGAPRVAVQVSAVEAAQSRAEVALPAPGSSISQLAPVPRPRPAWMG